MRVEAADAVERSTPMRFPTSAQHVDVVIVETRRAELRFRTDADWLAFEALPADERADLRRAFEMQARNAIA